ncbi:bifunctional serine/threonine protein kinase/MFS transporter [Streptomyces sp. NPDC012888]|uniref:bifunctional serine/threonine protein kinase/MFS transporter n=1 Tax=Streptomyces sp. NPDC012888 TaxID=3364855 RepID=UPI00368F6DBE
MDQLTGEDPTHIGAYRLIARLGAGGMGLVYLGRSEGGRTVAVKVVQAEHAGHPEFRRRFAREVAAARRVGGDWTAAVLDADPEAVVPWVATQYIPGPDLTSVVARDYGPLPEHSVRTLANRLALALQAVHAAGLIHRDLKPSNVLVTVDGPRVIDFGIARAMDSLAGDSLHTRTGMLIGSPGFMSPEQVRGLDLTPASDVFCLGAVLVYAATGRLLFGATDTGLNAHLFRVAEEEPDLTGVPESLLPLVGACLQKDPALRPTLQQIAEGTVSDGAEEWLPGVVLAQLGRHAAQLLDYAPQERRPARSAGAGARVPVAPAPAYTPTTPAHHVPPQGFGPAPRASAPYPQAQAAAGPRPKRWPGVVAVLAQLAVVFAVSSFALSIGAVQADLGLHGEDIGSLVGLYSLGTAGTLLLGGHLADSVGARRILTIGLSGFTAASVVGALATSFGLLAGSRALQGACAGLVLSAALSLVTGGFTDTGERRRAFGAWVTVLVGGVGVGACVSGLTAEFLSWRVAGLVGVVPCAVAALICTLRLPADVPGPARRFDTASVLLGTGGLLAFAFALVPDVLRGGAGLTWSPMTLLTCVAGSVLLVGYLRRQTTADGPFSPRHLVGMLALVAAGVGMVSLLWPLSHYLFWVLGLAPATAGLLQLPLAGGAAIGALVLAPVLTRRTGPRTPGAVGLLVAASGVAVLALGAADADDAYAIALAALVFGLGAGLGLTPLFAAVTADATPLRAGGAAAAALAAQQLGDSAGAALLPPWFESEHHWWGAGSLVLAAVLAVTCLPSRTPEDSVR